MQVLTPFRSEKYDCTGGEPCFAATRDPVQTLIDHIQGNATLDEFLEGFPAVSREQAIQFRHPCPTANAERPTEIRPLFAAG